MTITEPSLAESAVSGSWQAKMQRLQSRPPLERKLKVLDDDDLKNRIAKARRDVERHKARDPEGDEVAGAQAELDRLEAEAAERTIVLTFRGLPRKAYEQLIVDHPPTKDQKAKGMEYNVDTFAPALVSACSVDGMPVEDARMLLEEWNQTEAGMLFGAALAVNQEQRLEVGLGNG